jgi:hypothetical protein
MKVDEAPDIDGIPESLWNNAPALNVTTSGGNNGSSSNVKLKSVYTNNTVYFLATWTDPTESLRRMSWVNGNMNP